MGGIDRQRVGNDPTVSRVGQTQNPIGGWYGLKKGLRGRFGMYMPPLMESLGLVELEHNAKGNRITLRKRYPDRSPQ